MELRENEADLLASTTKGVAAELASVSPKRSLLDGSMDIIVAASVLRCQMMDGDEGNNCRKKGKTMATSASSDKLGKSSAYSIDGVPFNSLS